MFHCSSMKKCEMKCQKERSKKNNSNIYGKSNWVSSDASKHCNSSMLCVWVLVMVPNICSSYSICWLCCSYFYYYLPEGVGWFNYEYKQVKRVSLDATESNTYAFDAGNATILHWNHSSYVLCSSLFPLQQLIVGHILSILIIHVVVVIVAVGYNFQSS